ncbi:MAG: 3-oxoacyl-[acyl-carrier-protein] reductase [Geobacteraceae bacterium GWC2_55_20]|nr:3-oxoacyl-[acyl-carrier-protein] reductase [Deltaproteobacteria bacterium]OGU03823.1 MAG: 3-oxoacyl-[acyl-carrier-protein] reductase [Geobacteraceae bacterium GWC2_55_20]OGU21156.1 MAG: 3-oxoacyl-[acyl-carrier-protein] reductase [Geobacteraceae bacterium GWF2_54_21]HBA71405.1 3-oxoacyl-ACP reductase [Geobacter sp.]HCE67469.1 3-oxoacyl-ACP reductase [Geobacter sp.]
MPKDKVAVITGASRGIGKSIALALAAQGASIVAVDMDQASTDAVVAELQAAGGKALAVVGNVTVTADAERMIDAAMEAFGRVDILVNNAGITRDGLLMRMKDEDWDAVLSVNLKGAFLCTRAAFKVMSKQRYGRIINIASIVGQMGNAGQANYCASKAGLIGLTKSNAREMAKRNITVNAVAPGFISTAMTDALSDKVRAELTSQIPMDRLGSADDIANAVLFLASEASGYITGHVLAVNGGMYM